jgi:hypothetical protein
MMTGMKTMTVACCNQTMAMQGGIEYHYYHKYQTAAVGVVVAMILFLVVCDQSQTLILPPGRLVVKEYQELYDHL